MPDFALKQSDPDRYYSTLFVPEPVQHDVMALYAFNAEIASVRERVKDVLPGEMRLEWWREVLNGQGRGAESHPVAAALLRAIERHRLPVKPLIDLIDARSHDLYDDLFETTDDLVGYAGETSSALLRLVGVMLEAGDPKGADAFGHGGVAYALSGLLRAFPYHIRQGRLMWPRDILARHNLTRDDVLSGAATPQFMAAWAEMIALIRLHEAKAMAALPQVAAKAKIALLPVFLVKNDVRRLAALGNPYAIQPPPAAWRRILTLWLSARKL